MSGRDAKKRAEMDAGELDLSPREEVIEIGRDMILRLVMESRGVFSWQGMTQKKAGIGVGRSLIPAISGGTNMKKHFDDITRH